MDQTLLHATKIALAGLGLHFIPSEDGETMEVMPPTNPPRSSDSATWFIDF